MAKNDLDYILFKILAYYYGVLQKKIRFDSRIFKALFDESVDEEYWMEIVRMPVDEGLLTGLNFVPAWGGAQILINDLSEGKITIAGVQFLKENSGMKKIAQGLSAATGIIANLAALVALI